MSTPASTKLGTFAKTEERDFISPTNQVWDMLNRGLKTLGHSHDHGSISVSEDAQVET